MMQLRLLPMPPNVYRQELYVPAETQRVEIRLIRGGDLIVGFIEIDLCETPAVTVPTDRLEWLSQ